MNRYPNALLVVGLGVSLAAATLIAAMLIAAVTPCQAEDSTWCYWDAAARGNGNGQSFVAAGPITLP
ncbi:hypothetical protein GQE99_06585 [Maritimibacter sp. DP07]|uniref:Uncharacterized protein n=1 Tax=Maritimibacter harenae TaxID=2606218 RepID=A0A845LZC4_9RHOB|nr:hypothetical protein [Maritimibacter harenae]MZR12686.1 hypothetical protein [Maritimibacter harenae]